MAQNIYDDPEFFKNYAQLKRQTEGLDGSREWPALSRLLPPVDGSAVLDLGCGFGWFSRWAAEAGAEIVTGVDLSEKMLERAHAMTSDPAIAYRRVDLDTIELPAERYDLVFSSLVVHYVADINRLFAQIARTLRPGGTVVFSVEHPIFSAAAMQQVIELDDGSSIWPIHDYLIEGARRTSWMVDGVEKQHRTQATYLNALIDAGLVIDRVVDWGELEGDERHRPWFLLVRAHKA